MLERSDSELVQLNVKVSRHLHHAVKLVAKYSDMTLSEFIEVAMSDEVYRNHDVVTQSFQDDIQRLQREEIVFKNDKDE